MLEKLIKVYTTFISPVMFFLVPFSSAVHHCCFSSSFFLSLFTFFMMSFMEFKIKILYLESCVKFGFIRVLMCLFQYKNTSTLKTNLLSFSD